VAGGSRFATPQTASSACGVSDATPSEDAPKHRTGGRCVDHAVKVVTRRASARDAAAVASAYLEAWRAGYHGPLADEDLETQARMRASHDCSAPSRGPTGSWRPRRLRDRRCRRVRARSGA
jgi:hypothetical protein